MEDWKLAKLEDTAERVRNMAVRSDGMNHYTLREATRKEILDLEERKTYLVNAIRKEESVAEKFVNCEGNRVAMVTPKSLVLSLEAIGILMSSQMPKLIEVSYPLMPENRRKELEVIGYGTAADFIHGQYDSVLWHPDIWDGAVAGSGAFVDKICENDDLPIPITTPTKPVVWWHGMCRKFDKNPFEEEVIWWTPDYELHGIYIYSSERIKISKVSHDHSSVGLLSFWFDGKVNNPYNMRIMIEPGIQLGDPLGNLYSVITAAQRFLRLPFVAPVKATPLNHNERKYYKRSNRTPPEVTTVLLRKAEYEKQPVASGEDTPESHRNYSCQFIVGGSTGFWRRPKVNSRTGEREYVRPYLKGNPSMPFRPSKSKIIHVAAR